MDKFGMVQRNFQRNGRILPYIAGHRNFRHPDLISRDLLCKSKYKAVKEIIQYGP